MRMATRAARSLKHEYALFFEQEIENYKESIPRSAILSIGDEAAVRLAGQQQFALTELLMCAEVDRIIAGRLRLPSYATWRMKRLKVHKELRRPEHWGLSSTDALVRTISTPELGAASHVLIAGESATRSALFLAANGCDVTTLDSELETVQRVLEAAVLAGIAERLHPVPADLSQWTPEGPLHAVVCSHAALRALSPRERARVIAVLQTATMDGGVHLVETIVAGSGAIDELRATYRGWHVSVERGNGDMQVFLARKGEGGTHVSH
jgi:hypothetical protein